MRDLPPYHILQDLRIDLAIFRHGFLDGGQVGLLLLVRDTDAALTPSFPTLLHGGVVHVTAKHQRPLKLPLLIWSRLEPVREGLAGALLSHTCLFCLIGAQPTVIDTIVALTGHSAFIPIA
jgi:hypothetical protein